MNRPICVLHFVPTIAPRYGGTSTVMPPMLKALRGLPGFEWEFATTDWDGPNRLAKSDVPEDLGTVHLFPHGDRSRMLKAWLAANIRRFDILHAHTLWNPPTMAACAAARRAGVPIVLSPHGMLSEYSWRRGWLKKRAYWWLVQRKQVRAAAAYHATSSVEAFDIAASRLVSPICEIPLGMEAAAFDAPVRPDWLRERCGPAAGSKPIVLFLSRIHPKKGILDFLLPAFARLKTDAFLAIAGGAAESERGYENAIREAIARPELAGRAALVGSVDLNDRWAAFDGAAAFCLPSHSENFGLVVTEAMARGCPVVVSEHVDAGRHAVEAGAGVMVPLSAERIAAALDGILSADRTEADRSAGREYVRRQLGWTPIAERMAAMYRSVLPETAGVAR